MTFKTRLSALRFVGPHFLKVFGDVDLAETLRHSNDRLMAHQAGASILSNEQVDRAGKLAIPLLGRIDGLALRFGGPPGLGNVVPRQTVAVDAGNRYVERLGSLLLHFVVALMTYGVGRKQAGPSCDRFQCRGAIRPLLSETRRDQRRANRLKTRTSDKYQEEQNPNVPRVPHKRHCAIFCCLWLSLANTLLFEQLTVRARRWVLGIDFHITERNQRRTCFFFFFLFA
jgi:hypothetical protein